MKFPCFYFRVQNNLLRDEAEHLNGKLKATQEKITDLENQVADVNEKKHKAGKELESALQNAKQKDARFNMEKKTHDAVRENFQKNQF